MAFVQDRDLLALEPGLFGEIGWAGQRLIDAPDASLSGTTLTAASADFEAAGVEAGRVASIGGTALEVVSRISATQLEVSLARVDADGAPVPAAQTLSGRVVVTTFAPQIDRAHRDLLRRVDLSEADAVVNRDAFAAAEAAEALTSIYGAALTGGVADAALATKAAVWERAAARLREGLRVEVDLDADGEADATRAVSSGTFRRA